MSVNDETAVFPKTYRRDSPFDRHQKDRILNLLQLKARCLLLDDELRLSFQCTNEAMSFYTAIGHAVDCLLYSQVTEEAVACLADGGPVDDLIKAVLSDANGKGVAISPLMAAINDLQALFQDRGEKVKDSVFLDFVVTTFSALEMFMGRVYIPLRGESPITLSTADQARNLIEKYNNAIDADKNSILVKLLKVSDYVSGLSRIEFVLSRLSRETYPDRDKHRQAIQLYAAARNTIHNLGMSSRSTDLRYSYDGVDLTLGAGAPMLLPDRRDIVRLCGVLLDIYTRVVDENRRFGVDVFLQIPDRLPFSE